MVSEVCLNTLKNERIQRELLKKSEIIGDRSNEFNVKFIKITRIKPIAI